MITVVSPVNIALIKYWGKRNTSLHLATNASLSITLSSPLLTTTTTVTTSHASEDVFYLNKMRVEIPQRMRLCIHVLKEKRKDMETMDDTMDKMSECGLVIASENTVPTAAGLASSASGYSALVYALYKLYQLDISMEALSGIARMGSGSACRSLFPGWVVWEKGACEDGKDSVARSIYPSDYWKDICVLVCVVVSTEKSVGSTQGMQQTVSTSTLFQQRLKDVPTRIESMMHAIGSKDWKRICELTMKDSNSMHACCLDTFPPIHYLSDISYAIMDFVHDWNEMHEADCIAYTFDAGPNAVILVRRACLNAVALALADVFAPTEADKRSNWWKGNDVSIVDVWADGILPPGRRYPGGIQYVIQASIGNGPRVVQDVDVLQHVHPLDP